MVDWNSSDSEERSKPLVGGADGEGNWQIVEGARGAGKQREEEGVGRRQTCGAFWGATLLRQDVARPAYRAEQRPEHKFQFSVRGAYWLGANFCILRSHLIVVHVLLAVGSHRATFHYVSTPYTLEILNFKLQFTVLNTYHPKSHSIHICCLCLLPSSHYSFLP